MWFPLQGRQHLTQTQTQTRIQTQTQIRARKAKKAKHYSKNKQFDSIHDLLVSVRWLYASTCTNAVSFAEGWTRTQYRLIDCKIWNINAIKNTRPEMWQWTSTVRCTHATCTFAFGHCLTLFCLFSECNAEKTWMLSTSCRVFLKNDVPDANII